MIKSLITVAVAASWACSAGETHVRPEFASEVYSDCMQEDAVGSAKCSDRSGWVVDQAGDAFQACIWSEARLHNAFRQNADDPMTALRGQIRVCNSRTGHSRSIRDVIAAVWKRVAVPTPDSQSTWRAGWRGTAWDNPDSIRVGVARGDCWPLVERQADWEECVKRSEKAEQPSKMPTASPR